MSCRHLAIMLNQNLSGDEAARLIEEDCRREMGFINLAKKAIREAMKDHGDRSAGELADQLARLHFASGFSSAGEYCSAAGSILKAATEYREGKERLMREREQSREFMDSLERAIEDHLRGPR